MQPHQKTCMALRVAKEAGLSVMVIPVGGLLHVAVPSPVPVSLVRTLEDAGFEASHSIFGESQIPGWGRTVAVPHPRATTYLMSLTSTCTMNGHTA